MSSFNSVQMLGNLTRDPEIRSLPGGTAVVKFGIAMNERFQGDGGEWRDRTTFVDVTMFGKRAEAFAKFHRKGSLAFVHGRLRLDEWDDKQTGQKRSKLYVVADGWEFVRGRSESGDEQPAREAAADDTPF